MIKPHHSIAMPTAEYRQYPALNYSHLKLMFRPALYKDMVLDGKKKDQTLSMGIGTAVHTLNLEPHLSDTIKNLKDYGHTDRRKWAAIRELEANNPSDLFFSDSEIATIKSMVKSVKDHAEAAKLYDGEINNEVSFFWHNSEYNFVCKGRADTVNFHEGYVVDLKTTQDAADFMNQVIKYGYHIQAAFYLQGMKAVTGQDFDWYWVAVDSKEPNDTYVYKMSTECHRIGEIETNLFMKTLRECTDTDTWPRGNEAVITGDIPSWYSARVLKNVEEGDKYN